MARTYKTLAQVIPGAASLTTLYTVPASTQSVVSSIIVCNQSATPTSFRLSIAVAALADTPKQYIAYDVPIGAFETIPFVVGVTLATTDLIRCYATLATVSFNVFGEEIA